MPEPEPGGSGQLGRLAAVFGAAARPSHDLALLVRVVSMLVRMTRTAPS